MELVGRDRSQEVGTICQLLSGKGPCVAAAAAVNTLVRGALNTVTIQQNTQQR